MSVKARQGKQTLERPRANLLLAGRDRGGALQIIGIEMRDKTREVERTSSQGRYRIKIRAALQHPDCPLTLDFQEIENLSKHLGLRLSRIWQRNADRDIEDA